MHHVKNGGITITSAGILELDLISDGSGCALKALEALPLNAFLYKNSNKQFRCAITSQCFYWKLTAGLGTAFQSRTMLNIV